MVEIRWNAVGRPGRWGWSHEGKRQGQELDNGTCCRHIKSEARTQTSMSHLYFRPTKKIMRSLKGLVQWYNNFSKTVFLTENLQIISFSDIPPRTAEASGIFTTTGRIRFLFKWISHSWNSEQCTCNFPIAVTNQRRTFAFLTLSIFIYLYSLSLSLYSLSLFIYTHTHTYIYLPPTHIYLPSLSLSLSLFTLSLGGDVWRVCVCAVWGWESPRIYIERKIHTHTRTTYTNDLFPIPPTSWFIPHTSYRISPNDLFPIPPTAYLFVLQQQLLEEWLSHWTPGIIESNLRNIVIAYVLLVHPSASTRGPMSRCQDF